MKSVAKIFDELVAVDPSLADHKKETMKAIKALLAEKPDTKFDQDFANMLKKSLMESQAEPSVKGGFFTKVGQHIRSHVRAYAGVFAALVITVVGVIGTQYFFAAPSVIAGNWSFEYKKIPYDVPSIDITFSRELDANSISKETVRFAPYIQGTPSLKDGNTISYKLDSKLKIGEHYMITLSSDIKSKYGAKIGRDISYEFEAIAGAKAMRIIPEGELKNVSKNIVVLFNIPVIPLGSLATKDKLPCPIEITPAVEGKCSWTSGSILEFIPSKPLPYATKYEVKVASKEGLLYPLSDTKTVSFKTPNLEVIGKGDGFSPENGIPLEFNAPVKTADLAKIVKVQESQKEIAVTVATTSGPSDVGRRFTITKNASPGLLYSTGYNVALSGALMPAEGNIAYTGATSFAMRSSDYLQNVQSYRNEYSETGALKDTPEIYNSNSTSEIFIAKKDGFLVLNFGEDVDLAKTKPYLAKSGARIECKTSYMKYETSEFIGGKMTTKAQDDKRRIKCELPDSLDYGVTYTLTIDQASNPHLRENVSRELKTFPKFEASDFTYVSNTQGCMYFTNLLAFGDYGTYGLEKHFETEPKSPIRSVVKDGIQQYDEVTGNSKVVKLCKDIPGKIAYVIGTRFNPHETYTLHTKSTLLDAVGNPLVANYEKKDIKAGDVTDGDRYAYSPSSKDVSVIPANVPLVVNFQTINLSQLDVEVCEMTKEEYASYLKDRQNANYKPVCQGSRVAKSLPVANKAWAIANNRFDLEKDVMGHVFTSPFILVRSTVNGKYNQGYSGYRKD
ncbi:MAG: Ig-like domain-containing protein [Patescibacteria group bacterium]